MIDTKAIRNKILDYAIQGKLTKQLSSDGNAFDNVLKLFQDKFNTADNKKRYKNIQPIAEKEVPFIIPNNWAWFRLEQIVHQITDGTHRTPTYQETGIPFLSVKNITSGFLDFSDVKYIPIDEHNELIKRCKPEKDDVLICRIGTLGKAIRIDTDIAFSIFVSLGLIKTRNKVLSDYLVTVINSGYGFNWINSIKAGGAMHADKINLNDLRLLPIPLPPFNEQERIQKKIDELSTLLDSIDNLQNDYQKNLTNIKNKLVTFAIQGKLTKQLPEDGTAEELYQQIQKERYISEQFDKSKNNKKLSSVMAEEIPYEIPENWKWIRFGQVITLQSGIDFKPEEYNDKGIGIPYITGASNLSPQGVIINRWTATPKNIANQGDVLLVCKGSGYGKIALFDLEEAHIARQIMAVKRTPLLDMKYIFYFLEANFMNIRESGQGLIPGIDRPSILNMLFPLPPLAEQKRIVIKLDELLSLCE